MGQALGGVRRCQAEVLFCVLICPLSCTAQGGTIRSPEQVSRSRGSRPDCARAAATIIAVRLSFAALLFFIYYQTRQPDVAV